MRSSNGWWKCRGCLFLEDNVSLDARERLIVALDVPAVKAAEAMAARLGDSVWFYKIGYQLAFAGGLSLAAELIAAGKQVFLDLKLHAALRT